MSGFLLPSARSAANTKPVLALPRARFLESLCCRHSPSRTYRTPVAVMVFSPLVATH